MSTKGNATLQAAGHILASGGIMPFLWHCARAWDAVQVHMTGICPSWRQQGDTMSLFAFLHRKNENMSVKHPLLSASTCSTAFAGLFLGKLSGHFPCDFIFACLDTRRLSPKLDPQSSISVEFGHSDCDCLPRFTQAQSKLGERVTLISSIYLNIMKDPWQGVTIVEKHSTVRCTQLIGHAYVYIHTYIRIYIRTYIQT